MSGSDGNFCESIEYKNCTSVIEEVGSEGGSRTHVQNNWIHSLRSFHLTVRLKLFYRQITIIKIMLKVGWITCVPITVSKD